MSLSHIMLEQSICLNISDRIGLANCIVSGLLLLVTIISVICAFKAYKHQKNRARKEAACDLARYYSENIIKRHSFVSTILKQSSLSAKVNELFPYDKLDNFDKDEASYFIDQHCQSYGDVYNDFHNIDPQIILNTKLSYASSFSERKDIINEHFKYDEEKEEKILIGGLLLQQDFFDKLVDFLNDLEWFSMSCRYGISDEEVLYQSLHSTFLSCVWQLYFYICDMNIRNEDKLYTNIIWLFNRWRKRLREIQIDAQKKQDLAIKEMKIAEEHCEAARHKLDSSKPKVHSGKPLK